MAVARLSGVTGGFSGRLGNIVYRQVDGVTIASSAPVSHDPESVRQLQVRRRLTLVNQLWQALSPSDIAAWRGYAEAVSSAVGADGRRRAVRGDNLFRGLAAKYLQVHGGFTAPTLPPTSPFFGDGIAVSVAASIGACEDMECGDPAPLWLGGEAGSGGEAFSKPPPPTPSSSAARSSSQEEGVGGGGK